MRKLFFVLLLAVSVLFPHVSYADQGWEIDNFHSDISVEPTGILHVVEDIAVDFNNQEKHGIYRDLPYVYQGDNNTTAYLNITVNAVRRNKESSHYKVTLTDKNVEIKRDSGCHR